MPKLSTIPREPLVLWNRFYQEHRNNLGKLKDWLQAGILAHKVVPFNPVLTPHLMAHYMLRTPPSATLPEGMAEALVPVSIILTERNITFSAEMSGFGIPQDECQDTYAIRKFNRLNRLSFYGGRIRHVAYMEDLDGNVQVEYMQEFLPVAYDYAKDHGVGAYKNFKSAYEELTRKHVPTAPAPLLPEPN
jgi:hypothetical protein